jgi:hypothetical protein
MTAPSSSHWDLFEKTVEEAMGVTPQVGDT